MKNNHQQKATKKISRKILVKNRRNRLMEMVIVIGEVVGELWEEDRVRRWRRRLE